MLMQAVTAVTLLKVVGESVGLICILISSLFCVDLFCVDVLRINMLKRTEEPISYIFVAFYSFYFLSPDVLLQCLCHNSFLHGHFSNRSSSLRMRPFL